MTSRQRSSGQGGIPNVGMVSGGEITHINLEHVWVEAWIDYHPSRGAKHSVGDSWVPMDASFKQYEYTEGMALEEQIPLRCQRSGSDHLSAKHHQRRGRLGAGCAPAGHGRGSHRLLYPAADVPRRSGPGYHRGRSAGHA